MAARPAGGADGGETPAAGGVRGVLCAALERGWLEDGADDAGNRGGLLRVLRGCGAGRSEAAGVHAVLAGARAVGGPELLRDGGAVSRCAGRAGLRSE